jgi:hypothetical protein
MAERLSARSAGTASKPTIYGLMNKHGVFHMSESCIDFDKEGLEPELESLTDGDPDAGWSIVPLYAKPCAQSATVPIEETEDSKGDWQCRDYADGWITFPTRKAAEKYQNATGALMRYVRQYPRENATDATTDSRATPK